MRQATMMKEAGAKWKSLSEEQKAIYIKKAEAAKEQYLAALEEYSKNISPEQRERERIEEKMKKEKTRRTRAKRLIRSLGKPKRPLSPYFLFLKEHDLKRSDGKPGINFEKVAQLAARWRVMSDAEKAKYKEAYDKAKVKYDEEVKRWKERMVEEGHQSAIDALKAKPKAKPKPKAKLKTKSKLKKVKAAKKKVTKKKTAKKVKKTPNKRTAK